MIYSAVDARTIECKLSARRPTTTS